MTESDRQLDDNLRRVPLPENLRAGLTPEALFAEAAVDRLVAEGLGLGMMTTCGYYDDRLHALLGLDGLEEAILYLAYLGPRAAP